MGQVWKILLTDGQHACSNRLWCHDCSPLLPADTPSYKCHLLSLLFVLTSLCEKKGSKKHCYSPKHRITSKTQPCSQVPFSICIALALTTMHMQQERETSCVLPFHSQLAGSGGFRSSMFSQETLFCFPQAVWTKIEPTSGL